MNAKITPIDPKSFHMRIEDEGVIINGTSIVFPTDSPPLESFLGKGRWCNEARKYTWDDYGFIAAGAGPYQLRYFEIYLSGHGVGSGPTSPQKYFTGTILVGGVDVNKDTLMTEVVAKKRGLPLVEKGPGWWASGTPFRSKLKGMLLGKSYTLLSSSDEGRIASICYCRQPGLLRDP